jgi:hydrogenase expression/formation protein HypE
MSADESGSKRESDVTRPPVTPSLNCPVPGRASVIRMSDGGGGRHMLDLLRDTVLPALGMAPAERTPATALHDSAILPFSGGDLAFTTDSYVVSPMEFPGSDIGSLAVFGTVNDLAMAGAVPIGLSCSLIIEEGFPREHLGRLVGAMGRAAATVGVAFVTGDTKVVQRGHGDGLYINTAGVGRRAPGVHVHPCRISEGDVILVSGDIGRHGIAVMAARASLGFETTIVSDAAPLHGVVQDMLETGIDVHCLRDLTRGGLGAALVELAEASGHGLVIEEAAVPVHPEVAAACEILGLDPMFVANEGRMVVMVPAQDAPRALAVMARHDVSRGAKTIGSVGSSGQRGVAVATDFGTKRRLDLPAGEQLPRIC